MMTERAINTQPLMERDVLPSSYPASPTTEEIIILGYDAYPTQTETHLTAANQKIELTKDQISEKRIEDGTIATLHELDSWISFKVKNALVDQIFTGPNAGENEDVEKNTLNITSIADMLRAELMIERDKHYQTARQLENVSIPSAQMRSGPELNSKNPFIYWQDDVDNLLDRVDVHDTMVEYIDTLGLDESDNFRNFTEIYIARTHDRAREEVIEILLNQKKELESRQLQDTERIKELEDTLDLLIDQNVETLGSEIVEHLTQQAKDLAQ